MIFTNDMLNKANDITDEMIHMEIGSDEMLDASLKLGKLFGIESEMFSSVDDFTKAMNNHDTLVLF